MKALIHGLENLLCCLLLATVILLACLQIVLRDLFTAGLPWIDPLIRHLVVCTGMTGAVIASRDGQHIAIDLVSRFLPPSLKKIHHILLSLAAAAVCSILGWAALRFVQDEASFGSTGVLGWPSWVWYLIFPLSFGAMALHFISSCFNDREDNSGDNEATTVQTMAGNPPCI